MILQYTLQTFKSTKKTPAGIGDHSDIVQAVDAEVEKLADAQDKLKSVKELLHPTKKTLVE